MAVRTIDEIFRDFDTDGVPASGPFHPRKSDIRDTLKALTEGSDIFPDNRVIRLNNANAGTANNIVVTAAVAIPAAAYQCLYILNVTQENTGPVTVSGAINRSLVTNINQPVPAGYLVPGMAVLCIDTGTDLRMLSYGDADAVLTGAERILADLVQRSVGAFPTDAEAEQYLAERSLTAEEGTIYFNTTDKIWRYWDGLVWQVFPYATIANGSVTDSKLPPFSDSVSPSAAKVRFLASTSSGAIAGAVARPLDEKLSESLHVADFGVKADGVSNDTVAFMSAWEAAKSTHRPLFADAGTIMIDPDVWKIGAQENGVAFFGVSSSPYMQQGTILKARVSGDVMFQINGFSEGHCLSGFIIDCDGKVKNACNIETCSNFTTSRFALLNFTEYGMKFICIAAANGLVSWSSNFTIEDFFITSSHLKDYGAGLYMSGTMDTISPPGPADPHLFTFRQGRIQVNKGVAGPTRGGDFGFVDSGQFYEVDFVGSGGGTMFQPVAFRATNNPGEPFPANLSFYSCSMQGGPIFSDDLHGRIYMAHFTTGDGESVPEGVGLLFGFTDRGYMFGDWSIERLSKEVIFNGDAAAKRRIRFSTPDNSQQVRMTHNSSLGFEVEVWTGTAWLLALRLYADGQVGMNFPGVGFRILGAGSADSAGSGRRSVSIPN